MIRKGGESTAQKKKITFELGNCVDFLRLKAPFLFDRGSLFYYALLILGVAFLWMAYAIFVNQFSVLYGWDYSSQYVTMSYSFRDMWWDFLRTGSFPLYSFETFLGTDNIGSNSYYGLFDPFLIPLLIFPRSWAPQMFVLAAMLKGVVSALTMRAYLRYMGVKEGSSRVGGLAYAFSGYLNFMVGFPSYLSMAFTLPLLLLGIEKALRERKPATIAITLMFLGMISFFFLVVFLIFGAMYAVWRFFQTMRKRNLKENVLALVAGAGGVLIGVALCAWVLLPSVRETSLSGRTTSVGAAYLAAIKKAFADTNAPDLIALLFMPVGGNAAREYQGLIGFFYPTCNYLWLPLAKTTDSYSYDSWTASLFCYTPMLILFFTSFVHNLRKGRWSHLLAFSICFYFLFTNLAYYLFYAFAGDGYGRWYIVLVPLIILYAAEEADRLPEEKPSTLIGGSLAALLGTILAFVIPYLALQDKTIPNWLQDGYAHQDYDVPGIASFRGISTRLTWIIYYQIALLVIESGVIFYMKDRKFLWKALFAFLVLEITVSGNLSFFYGSMHSYSSWLGGSQVLETANSLFSKAYEDEGDGYFRAYSDLNPDRNTNMAYGYNGTSHFHSLFNYDLADLARYSYITNNEGTGSAFGEDIVTKSWSAYYGNKRAGFDMALGTKYYLVMDEGYPHGYDEFQPNVPFGSTLIAEQDGFRLYESPYADEIGLGHRVEHLYAEGIDEESRTRNKSDFFSDSSGVNAAREILRNEQSYISGAILQDEDVEAVLEELNAEGGSRSIEPAPVASAGSALLTSLSSVTKATYIETVHGNGVDYGYYAYDEEEGIDWDPGYFLTYREEHGPDHESPDSPILLERTHTTQQPVVRDFGKVVIEPTGDREYLNEDPEGAYFVMDMTLSSGSDTPRVYFIGDKDVDGDGVEEHNVVLSYEYNMISNWAGHYVRYSGDVFGFYVPGKARYAVFCFKGSGYATFTEPTLYVQERSLFEENIDSNMTGENALKDVSFKTDCFAFRSDYDVPELVVTVLGYDAGWSLSGTNGEETVSPSIYKLDGGLVGFVLPSGDWNWTLRYRTPGLSLGVGLAMGGVAALGVYFLGAFLYRQKENERLRNEPPAESTNSGKA